MDYMQFSIMLFSMSKILVLVHVCVFFTIVLAVVVLAMQFCRILRDKQENEIEACPEDICLFQTHVK